MGIETDDERRALEAELARLASLLELDETWRALRDLETRAAAGSAEADPELESRRAALRRALATNRLYAAYQRAIDALGRVDGTGAVGDAGSPFRTRVRIKRGVEARGAGGGTPPAVPVDGLGLPPDDLTQIRGLSRHDAERLAALGVRSPAQIAAWRRDDVVRAASALGVSVRDLARRGWIEQAALLAAGRSTAYADMQRGGPAATAVPPPADPPSRSPTLSERLSAARRSAAAEAPADPRHPLSAAGAGPAAGATPREAATRPSAADCAPEAPEAVVTIRDRAPAAVAPVAGDRGTGAVEAGSGAPTTGRASRGRRAGDRLRAAYHFEIEEASVEIVRRDGSAPAPRATHDSRPTPAVSGPGALSRLLTALRRR